MTYEYVCTACSHAWETEQAISAAPLKICPKCGTEHAKRQISGGAGFILKGGGWYADGYGSSKSSGGAGPRRPPRGVRREPAPRGIQKGAEAGNKNQDKTRKTQKPPPAPPPPPTQKRPG